MSKEIDVSKVLFSESEIAKRVKEIADCISNDYDGISQLVLVGVMNGAIYFLHDLAQQLRANPSGTSILVTKARTKSTGPKGSKICWLPSKDFIKNQDVLIVEDLVSTGSSCKILRDALLKIGAKSVKICTMLYYSKGIKHDIKIDYFGFKVPHYFWAGYGIDNGNDKYRELPCIKRLDQIGKT